jgi:hypothetical protein
MQVFSGLAGVVIADIHAVPPFCGHAQGFDPACRGFSVAQHSLLQKIYDAHGNNRQNKLMYSREPLTHTTNVSIHFGKTVNRQNDTSSLHFFVT